ncbi:MAG: hypothetical protein HYT63_01500 [Candidatus Yanofskybacteria bacterium]|nr:hypothetical protein [Candidatus Yanofskybacteria bacterium]
MYTEKIHKNRLVEDGNFYERIRLQIIDEPGNLSRIYDDQMADLGYGTWQEKIDKIKRREKLGAEIEARNIVLEVAFKSGLSSVELDYLLNLLFKPRKQKVDDD